MAKERVDVLAYKQGLFETREQAKRGVMAGLVVAVHNGERFDKPGEKIDEATELKLKGEKLKYVSRGGLKLEKALDLFEIDLQDKVTLDIGASTGGFTDVMLQNGAALVYAVDVGTNQLAWKLRQDPRVISMEQFNFRYATSEDLSKPRALLALMLALFPSTSFCQPSMEFYKREARWSPLSNPSLKLVGSRLGKMGLSRMPRSTCPSWNRFKALP